VQGESRGGGGGIECNRLIVCVKCSWEAKLLPLRCDMVEPGSIIRGSSLCCGAFCRVLHCGMAWGYPTTQIAAMNADDVENLKMKVIHKKKLTKMLAFLADNPPRPEVPHPRASFCKGRMRLAGCLPGR
jgi:hypothetical protein